MYSGFGIVPDTTTIAAGKPYVFVYKLGLFHSGNPAVYDQLAGQLAPYASNIAISRDGSDLTLTLTPTYSMPLSGWRASLASAVDAIGESGDLKDAYAGAVTTPEPAPSFTSNISKYWGPKLKELGVPAAFGWIETVVIAGAVIVGGIALMRIVPKKEK